MFKWIKHFIEQSWLLMVSAFIFGLLIAVTYTALEPRIAQNKIDRLNRLMSVLISDAKSFVPALDEPVLIDLGRGRTTKSNIYRALDKDGGCLGFCFNAEGPGFADKIELVIAVDAAFKTIEGYSVLSSNETPGFGDRIGKAYYRNQFRGIPAQQLDLSRSGNADKIDDEIIAITGATISSEAVVKIFNTYIGQIKTALTDKGLIGNVRK